MQEALVAGSVEIINVQHNTYPGRFVKENIVFIIRKVLFDVAAHFQLRLLICLQLKISFPFESIFSIDERGNNYQCQQQVRPPFFLDEMLGERIVSAQTNDGEKRN